MESFKQGIFAKNTKELKEVENKNERRFKK